MPSDVIRTYETFDVEWTNEDGSTSTWTNFTEAEAQAHVDFAIERGGRPGRVVRRTFEVCIPARLLPIATGAFLSERAA